jgi:hypothetical protein
MRRVANRASTSEPSSSDRFVEDAEMAEQQAALLRDAVTEYAARGLSVLAGSEERDG